MRLLDSIASSRITKMKPGRNTGSALTAQAPVLLAAATILVLQGCSDNPVQNGDAIYAVQVDEPVRVLEGTDLVFTVTRSTDLSRESTLFYSFSGEATLGDDYDDPNNGSLSFSPGESSLKIQLETLGDDETEEEESVEISLLRATDGGIDPSFRMATGYIRDGIPSCVGAQGTVVFIDFDDIRHPSGTIASAGGGMRLADGYKGFIWGDWWARDNVMRSQDDGLEPGRGWLAGTVSAPNSIYPSFGAQPGSVSVITSEEPFVLQSFRMSALHTDDLPVTLRYRDGSGNVVGQETFVVSRGEKALIEPDVNIMTVNCLASVSFTQPLLGASFIIDDMTLVH